jgi:ABC-type enterobactin transport system permease subunit
MLDDDAGKAAVAKLRDELERGVGIVVIVVAERLALDLLGLGDAAAMRAGGQIERRLLVRVLAVAQSLAALSSRAAGLREHLPLVGEGEPLGDRRIVGGGRGESLCRQIFAELE